MPPLSPRMKKEPPNLHVLVEWYCNKVITKLPVNQSELESVTAKMKSVGLVSVSEMAELNETYLKKD
jgi:hypothetical protein